MNCIFHYVVVFTMLLKANWWPLAGWVLQGLLGPMGLMSANPLEQQAAISSLSTLMSITPRDTYIEFEKVCFLHQLYLNFFLFKWGQWCYIVEVLSWLLTETCFSCQHLQNLPDRYSHDMLSENDVLVNSSAFLLELNWICDKKKKQNQCKRLILYFYVTILVLSTYWIWYVRLIFKLRCGIIHP